MGVEKASGTVINLKRRHLPIAVSIFRNTANINVKTVIYNNV